MAGPFSRSKIRKVIQEKIEDVADSINPNLGGFVRKGNEIQNKVLDPIDRTKERFTRTIINGVDSSHTITYLRRFLGEDAEDIQVGDHLWVQRFHYTHHGLYYGNGQVIHYLKEGVAIDSLETFAKGSVVRKKSNYLSPAKYSPTEIISRAQSRLGETSYNLGFNNCEHFCRWSRNNEL